ncbi:MAG: hypothetical protein VCB06_04480, partial [Alphaproteobacteria bacterium]
WRHLHRKNYEAWAVPPEGTALGAVDMNQVMAVLGQKLPDDCTVANDAGNFATWLHRFYPLNTARRRLGPLRAPWGLPSPAQSVCSLPDRVRRSSPWSAMAGF